MLMASMNQGNEPKMFQYKDVPKEIVNLSFKVLKVCC